MEPVTVIQGSSPLVLAQPHSGTWLPDDVRAVLNGEGLQLLDTEWRIPELYEGLSPDATVVRANFSRYVIDANRPPDGASLYPGQNTTGLVPLVTFDDKPIWRTEPDEPEIARRLEFYHQPYHAALEAEIIFPVASEAVNSTPIAAKNSSWRFLYEPRSAMAPT